MPKQRKSQVESFVNVSQDNQGDNDTPYLLSFSTDIISNASANKEYKLLHVKWNGDEYARVEQKPLPSRQLRVRDIYEHLRACVYFGRTCINYFACTYGRDGKIFAY